MVTCTIRPTEKHANSSFVSIQQDHIELFVKRKLFSILLCTPEGEIVREYKGPELARLIASAIGRGRRSVFNSQSEETEYYFLGDR